LVIYPYTLALADGSVCSAEQTHPTRPLTASLAGPPDLDGAAQDAQTLRPQWTQRADVSLNPHVSQGNRARSRLARRIACMHL